MNSLELPLWQRGTTAVLLIAAAWFIRGSESLVNTVGESAIRLTAGVAALSVILGMKMRFGFWPTRLRRSEFSSPAALLGALAGAVLIAFAGRAGAADVYWAGDRGTLLAAVIGAAAVAITLGATRFGRSARWFALAAGFGLAPWLIGVIALRVASPSAVNLDGQMLVGFLVFLLVVNSLVLLVTDELAFRRLIVGRAGGAGLAVVLLGAFVYAVWYTFLPVDPQGPFGAFTGGFARGVAAGSLYVLSQSLLVSALFSGFVTAGIDAISRLLVQGGTESESVVSFLNYVNLATLVCAVALAFLVYRKVGMGLVGEYSLNEDAAGS